MSVLAKYSPLRIGWRLNKDGNLVPVDDEATARYAESIALVRDAYLAQMREKGYLPAAGNGSEPS